MKHLALIGANGYVGTGLYKELVKNKKIHVQAVTRKNYDYWKKRKFDAVINCAMPSARFWAEKNPYKDFEETVLKTADIVYGWRYKKLILISTISARTEKNSIYGKHKAIAEELCEFGDNLIIRLTATFGPTLKKGALIDIIEGKKVYVDKKSRYSFSNLEFVCRWICNNLQRKGIVEVGAKNSISLEEIVKILKLSIKFEGRTDIQQVQKPEKEFPNAKDVIIFVRERIGNKIG